MTREDAHDPRAIANQILAIASEQGVSVTLMKLIKLVYLADGWSIALRNRPMSKVSPQAWQHGPVFPTVYSAFKRFGSSPITSLATLPGTDIPYAEAFTDDEMALLRQVVSSYGKYHAFRLSEVMHQPGTPWSQTIESEGKYAEIPLGVIAEHFRTLRVQRGVAPA